MVLTPAQALTRIRQICLALAEATEKEAWGAPTFRVRDRLFVMFVNNHHGDGRLAIWCNAGPGAQAAIVEADPKRFFVPPYVGPAGWIGIRLDRRPNWAVVAALVEEGYRTAAARTRAAKRKRGTATTPPQRARATTPQRRRGHRGARR
jgi:predicted DNA-binding protein (MmcQ/YjbR family)